MSAHSIDLRAGERIVGEVRRHMFVFYTHTFFLFVLALVPLLFAAPAVRALSGAAPGHGGGIAAAVYGLFFLILTTVFFFQWTDYYLDVWVVTTERIFDIEQKGLFHRDISVFELERIQDVNVVIAGVIATFLEFGDVHIHTAGDRKDLVIRSAGKPLSVKRMIMDAYAARTGTLRANGQPVSSGT